MALAEYMTVRPRAGGSVHAVTWLKMRTACGRKFDGWILVKEGLNCQRCQDALFEDE